MQLAIMALESVQEVSRRSFARSLMIGGRKVTKNQSRSAVDAAFDV
jgi:hypothetical protein